MPRPIEHLLKGGAAGRRVALILSAIWLAMVAVFWMFVPGENGISVAGVLAVVLPLALIWMAAGAAQALKDLRDEADSLHRQLEAMKAAAQAPPQPTQPAPSVSAVPRQVPRSATPPAARPPRPAAEPEQPSLALETPPENASSTVPHDTLVRALNFPEGPDDAEGRDALRAALADKQAERLVRAAQDILTLLARDGIFMDDLTPDRARPELWRRFAKGERGREVAALGGVRDQISLAIASDAMRGDAIFRDAAHHFLRQFDRSFASFETDASDAQIIELAETRTARAFMLLGRASGTFD